MILRKKKFSNYLQKLQDFFIVSDNYRSVTEFYLPVRIKVVINSYIDLETRKQ